MRIKRLIAIAGLQFTTCALAAHRIEQTVEGRLNDKPYTGSHSWFIDEGRFRLDVTSTRGKALYLFNGNNLYICGKLDANDQQFLAKHQLHSERLMTRFKDGACQAVPSNFMARFFLAQSLAAESLDRADGMQVTLAVSDYKLQATGKRSGSGLRSCQWFERSYVVQKNTTEGGTYRLAATEQLCVAPTPDWRPKLWLEVSKALLRQRGGASLLAQLKIDRESLTGFPMQLISQYELTMPDRSVHKGQIKAKATASTIVPKESESFRLPPGYQIFAPETADFSELTAAPSKDQKTPEALSSNEQSVAERLLQAAQSVFLCAISGSIGCIVTD